MNERILISVIVPVYNGEKFIDRAVQSVLCQMNGQVELILVNDGSTDNSGAMCDAYAAEHPNIRVIHKENGGTSSAKNAGIAAAVGKYISFMDIDDYIDTDTYMEVSRVIDAYEPDCIDFGWKYIGTSGRITSTHHKVVKNRLLYQDEIEQIILPPLLNLKKDEDHFIFDFACNKVFKADIIKANNIGFDVEKRVWEDRTFLLRCLRHSNTFYSMVQCFYNYVDVPGSLSRRYSMDFFDIILANFRDYSEMYGDKFDFDTQYVNDYWCHAIENMIFRSLEQQENQEQIRQNILKTLKNEQVIHWYSKRIPANAFESAVSPLITSHQYEKALTLYAKEITLNRKKQRFQNTIRRIKQVLRNMLRSSS